MAIEEAGRKIAISPLILQAYKLEQGWHLVTVVGKSVTKNAVFDRKRLGIPYSNHESEATLGQLKNSDPERACMEAAEALPFMHMH
jgi:hypothetical protein